MTCERKGGKQLAVPAHSAGVGGGHAKYGQMVQMHLTTETTHRPGKPRKGVVSGVQMQITTEATHNLESQDRRREQGSKCS